MINKNDFEVFGGVLTKYNGVALDIFLPNGIFAIGESVFENMFIKSITMSSVIEIRDNAFKGCKYLSIIVFSEDLEYIGAHAFESCINLSKIKFPSSLKKIMYAAFKDCSNLQFDDLPNKLYVIDYEAFLGCVNIKKISFPDTVDYFATKHTLGHYGNNFVDYYFEEVILPKNLTKLPCGMFQSCKKLKYVELPENLEEIPGALFRGCINLQFVRLPQTVTLIGSSAFENSGLECIDIPEKVRKIECAAFAGTKIKEVIIPEFCVVDGEESIDEYGYDYWRGAFGDCKQLQKVTIPPSASISSSAFNGCDNYKTENEGCYIATCVYGSYDCLEVKILRNFRDCSLRKLWYGKLLIRCYYATSPTLVKMFGNTKWFKKVWKLILDKMITILKEKEQ